MIGVSCKRASRRVDQYYSKSDLYISAIWLDNKCAKIWAFTFTENNRYYFKTY